MWRPLLPRDCGSPILLGGPTAAAALYAQPVAARAAASVACTSPRNRAGDASDVLPLFGQVMNFCREAMALSCVGCAGTEGWGLHDGLHSQPVVGHGR